MNENCRFQYEQFVISNDFRSLSGNAVKLLMFLASQPFQNQSRERFVTTTHGCSTVAWCTGLNEDELSSAREELELAGYLSTWGSEWTLFTNCLCAAKR